MTLTPEREEEVRKAWNEKEIKPKGFKKYGWLLWTTKKLEAPMKYFRADFITSKGWDKERV